MDSRTAVFVLIAMLILALFPAVVKAVEFFTLFIYDARFIKSEIKRAYDDEEREYWKRELKCHYLCLIPFVNDNNVQKVYKKIYIRPKHAEKTAKNDSVFKIIVPSLTGLIACAVCLSSMSWAWFTASRSSDAGVILTAKYTVDITVTKSDNINISLDFENGAYKKENLESGVYTLKIKPTGNAKHGYCKIMIDDQSYFSKDISKEGVYLFKIDVDRRFDLAVTPQWGECAYPYLQGDIPLIKVESNQNQSMDESNFAAGNPVLSENLSFSVNSETENKKNEAIESKFEKEAENKEN